MIHGIKSGLEIKKGNVSVSTDLVCLLDGERESRDLIHSGAIWYETHLFRASFTSYSWKSPGEKYVGDLSRDGKKCDASAVVADRLVTFVFPEGENDTPGPGFRGVFSDPNMVDDVGKPLDGVIPAQFHHCCGDVADA